MKSMLRKFSRSNLWLAVALTVILFAVNVIALPSILAPANLISTLALLAPLIIIAFAATPSILSGGGGIDVSMGSMITFTNVAMFVILPFMGIQNPVMMVVTLLLFGAIIGTVSGLLVTVVRLQPIVATLGVNLVLTGISVHLMPTPLGKAAPWLKAFAGYMGPIPGPLIIVAFALVLWGLLTLLPYHKALLAVGGDDRAAFSSGLNVTLIRTLAYTLGGFLAALAGISITAFVGAGNTAVGANFTLIAIASVALGGTSLAGGSGGMIGTFFGATAIFFIQKGLNTLAISSFWFQVAYGAILLAALAANSLIRMSARKKAGE